MNRHVATFTENGHPDAYHSLKLDDDILYGLNIYTRGHRFGKRSMKRVADDLFTLTPAYQHLEKVFYKLIMRASLYQNQLFSELSRF